MLVTRYTGDLPRNPQRTLLISPGQIISNSSCLTFEYKTITSTNLYVVDEDDNKQDLSHEPFQIEHRSSGEHDAYWKTMNVDLPIGEYQIMFENMLSDVSLMAAQFTSGVIYPFMMDNVMITEGACRQEGDQLLFHMTYTLFQMYLI